MKPCVFVANVFGSYSLVLYPLSCGKEEMIVVEVLCLEAWWDSCSILYIFKRRVFSESIDDHIILFMIWLPTLWFYCATATSYYSAQEEHVLHVLVDEIDDVLLLGWVWLATGMVLICFHEINVYCIYLKAFLLLLDVWLVIVMLLVLIMERVMLLMVYCCWCLCCCWV